MTLSVKNAKHIKSAQNSKYKLWKKYLKNGGDPENPWIGVEGKKQVSELSKIRIPELVLLSSIQEGPEAGDLIGECREAYFLPEKLFSGLSSVEQNQGIIAFFKKPRWSLDDLTDRIIILERLQDPGNMGTILRTASALGDFSIIINGNSVSCFNQKVVRASAGYLFTVPFLTDINPEELRKMGYSIWHSFPVDGTPVDKADFQVPLAVVFGSEGQGLKPQQAIEVESMLTIPMNNGRDSLNVAVAASLVMYEVNKRTSG